MTANRILELMNQSPFMPLEIHLADGAAIRVENPYDIAVHPNSPDCTIFEEDRKRIVSVRNITEAIAVLGTQ